MVQVAAVGAALARTDPRAWGPRPCPLAERNGRPRVRAKRRRGCSRLSACSVLGPLRPVSPRPWPRSSDYSAKPPPATWRGRSQSRGTRWIVWGRGAGPPPQTPGRRARPQAGRNVRGQERAKLPVCGHRKEGELVTVQGEGAGLQRATPAARAPRLPLPHSSDCDPAAPSRVTLFCPCSYPPSLSQLKLQKSKFPFEDLTVEEFLTPDPSAPVPRIGRCQVPGAGQRRAEQLAVLTCRRIGSMLSRPRLWRGLAGRSVEPFTGSG